MEVEHLEEQVRNLHLHLDQVVEQERLHREQLQQERRERKEREKVGFQYFQDFFYNLNKFHIKRFNMKLI